jgi:hypothetical protein
MYRIGYRYCGGKVGLLSYGLEGAVLLAMKKRKEEKKKPAMRGGPWIWLLSICVRYTFLYG